MQEQTIKRDFGLSRSELIAALENSKQETFKYVNKFLELEEKWSFINILLKRLNSIRQKQELCKTICEGFLQLTNSKACFCCFFNQDTHAVEAQKIEHSSNMNIKYVEQFIEEINCECVTFMNKSTGADEILNIFIRYQALS